MTAERMNRPANKFPLKLMIGCLSGCGVLILGLIIILVVAVKSGGKASKAADIVARQAISAVRQNRLEDFCNLCSPEFANTVSKQATKDVLKQWRDMAGAMGDPQYVSQNWYTNGGGTQISLVYHIQGSKHNMEVRMVLISHGGPYRVLSCNFAPYGK